MDTKQTTQITKAVWPLTFPGTSAEGWRRDGAVMRSSDARPLVDIGSARIVFARSISDTAAMGGTFPSASSSLAASRARTMRSLPGGG
jgi:hypothetical protein